MTAVIREVTENVWTFSRPFARFGLVPVGGRSTAIKLRNGNVWVMASTPLDGETKEKLKEIGPVRYICSGDMMHCLFVGEFKKEYPDAKVYAVLDALPKLEGINVDGVWGRDPPDTKYEFEDEIKAVYLSGFRNKDVAFFHADSKTLVVADLIFNLPATEQYSKVGQHWLPGTSNLSPYSRFHARFLNGMTVDKAAMKRDAKTVADLDFERIIPCHGDTIEGTGNQAWRYAYQAFLN